MSSVWADWLICPANQTFTLKLLPPLVSTLEPALLDSAEASRPVTGETPKNVDKVSVLE